MVRGAAGAAPDRDASSLTADIRNPVGVELPQVCRIEDLASLRSGTATANTVAIEPACLVPRELYPCETWGTAAEGAVDDNWRAQLFDAGNVERNIAG